MLQSPVFDGLAFDLFPFQQDGLAARGIAEGLVIARMIVVRDEGLDPGIEINGQVVAFKHDAVLQRLIPSLDLALGPSREALYRFLSLRVTDNSLQASEPLMSLRHLSLSPVKIHTVPIRTMEQRLPCNSPPI